MLWFFSKALNQLKSIYNLGLDKLPILYGKNSKSLSDDEKKIGRPKVSKLQFESLNLQHAGFIIPILGDMMRMPGFASVPAAAKEWTLINLENNRFKLNFRTLLQKPIVKAIGFY